MALVSKNPKNMLNPETAENCVIMDPANLKIGQEFIGFYKHMYVDSQYNNKCYVFKGRDDGIDHLFYGSSSLHTEMSYYTIGDLVSITYHGQKPNKGGRFAGKMAHIWKVLGESTWIPSPEFIQQLQQEVYNRRIEVQRQLSNPQGINIPPQQKQMHNPNYGTVQVSTGAVNYPTQSHLPTAVASGSHSSHATPSSNPFLNPYGTKPTDPFG